MAYDSIYFASSTNDKRSLKYWNKKGKASLERSTSAMEGLLSRAGLGIRL